MPTSADRQVWIVVPAYNEAENLQVTVPDMLHHLLAVCPTGCLLVVDDGSTDTTVEVLADLMAAHPQVRYQRHARNRGKAAVLRDGFSQALDGDADVVVMMDADGQDDPSELGRLLAELQPGVGVVTGARNSARNDRFIKRTTSLVYNKATRVLSGTPGTDFNSGFKALSADAARQVSAMLYGEMHRYITVVVYWLGYGVREVSVAHHERLHGKTKYGIARFWRGFIDLVTVRFLMSYENRPSHLFGGLGLLCTGAGGLALMYLLALRLSGATIGDRPLLSAAVLLVVVGVQLVLFGLLAELIVFVRHNDRRPTGG